MVLLIYKKLQQLASRKNISPVNCNMTNQYKKLKKGEN
jgi:hypothetical protein